MTSFNLFGPPTPDPKKKQKTDGKQPKLDKKAAEKAEKERRKKKNQEEWDELIFYEMIDL